MSKILSFDAGIMRQSFVSESERSKTRVHRSKNGFSFEFSFCISNKMNNCLFFFIQRKQKMILVCVDPFCFKYDFKSDDWIIQVIIQSRLLLTNVVVPTFDTKVTEYLCSGWVFFLQTNIDFLTSHFWRNFLIPFKRYCCPELNLKRYFTCDCFS